MLREAGSKVENLYVNAAPQCLVAHRIRRKGCNQLTKLYGIKKMCFLILYIIFFVYESICIDPLRNGKRKSEIRGAKNASMKSLFRRLNSEREKSEQ